MQPWKTLSRRLVLDHGKFLKVEEHTVQLPNGRTIPNWDWVITPDYVIILPENEGGEFLIFEQNKYGVEGKTLAPVGGYIEPGEEPLAAAQRELLEELGCTASLWTSLGRFRVDANRGAGTANLFYARGVQRVQEPDSDDLEEQKLLLMDRAGLRAALQKGEFKVLAWATAVALMLLYST
jgi:ADP-ribose pyrophosphatase